MLLLLQQEPLLKVLLQLLPHVRADQIPRDGRDWAAGVGGPFVLRNVGSDFTLSEIFFFLTRKGKDLTVSGHFFKKWHSRFELQLV